MWEDNEFRNLGTLGGRSASANSINSYGQIVGWSFDGTSPDLRAFIVENGVMTNLNELIAVDSEWTLIRAYDINNNGVVNVADVLLATRAALGTLTLNTEQLARGNVAPLDLRTIRTNSETALFRSWSASLGKTTAHCAFPLTTIFNRISSIETTQ